MSPASVTYTGSRTSDGSPVVSKQIDDLPPTPLAVRHDLARHADAGNWGYFGSGPRQLAVMLLADVLGDEAATALSQRFKADVLARWPPDAFRIKAAAIEEWAAGLPEFHPPG